MRTDHLTRSIKILLLFFLVFGGLYFTKSFLVPVVFGGVLAMLFMPLCRWLEGKGLRRWLASIICVLLLLVLLAGVATLLAWQVNGLAQEASKMHEQVSKVAAYMKETISETLGISEQKQKKIIEEQSSSGVGGAAKMLAAAINSSAGLFMNMVLILVYTFLFIYQRAGLKEFVLKLVDEGQKAKTIDIIKGSSKVAQQYLAGLGKVIAILWVLYGIGYSIVGVKHAIFFAVLCGLLEIIPFVGNLVGTSVTLLMAFTQGGDLKMCLGVIVTYMVVQFVQSYVLEPVIVGAQVRINPLFTIIALLAGELIWGIPGMILAIPIIGIAKIVFDHIGPLKPYGFLIGEEKKKEKKPFFKKWFKR